MSRSLAFGSTIGPAREAARRLAAAGRQSVSSRCGFCRRCRSNAIARALAGVRRIIVVEQNHSAQLYHHLIGQKAIPPERRKRGAAGAAAVPAV